MKTLTVKQFADRVGWSHDMVTREVKAGNIKGLKKNPFAKTSPFLIPESELDRVEIIEAGKLISKLPVPYRKTR